MDAAEHVIFDSPEVAPKVKTDPTTLRAFEFQANFLPQVM